MNDWLQIEFRERISPRRKIILTDKLSAAFRLVEIPVTKEMIEEENKVIELSNKNYNFTQIATYLGRMREHFQNPEWLEAINRIREATSGLSENIKKLPPLNPELNEAPDTEPEP